METPSVVDSPVVDFDHSGPQVYREEHPTVHLVLALWRLDRRNLALPNPVRLLTLVLPNLVPLHQCRLRHVGRLR